MTNTQTWFFMGLNGKKKWKQAIREHSSACPHVSCCSEFKSISGSAPVGILSLLRCLQCVHAAEGRGVAL